MKKLKTLFIFALTASFSVIFTPNLFAEPSLPPMETDKEISLGDSLVNLKESLVKENLINTASVIKQKKESSLNLKEVFYASPLIYSILFIMSLASCIILFYTMLTFRHKDLISKSTIEDLKDYLSNEKYEEAIQYCKNKKNLLSSMIASGINARKHGAQYMIDTIKAEGTRSVADFWQRISLLSDIVVIAPMLGLLGTVIGMFYAFYDINRSIDTLSSLFDGLGIAVGTTVAGLIVAILATCFYSILKFKMIKALGKVENEAVALGNLIKTKD